MMNYKTEVVVAVPPWKMEFIERKRKKSKSDEVPQWKRELLKRIQSKNQRMIEEQQQADILEEHIPKVSDNIFLLHEKKPHSRFSSAPTPKTITPEISPSALALSIDNVIIIEKETKDVVDDVTPTSSSDSVFGTNDEDKEYPKAGIVHRLLGRFQSEESAAPKTTPFHSDTSQQYNKSTEFDKTRTVQPITPPPSPQSSPVEEKVSTDILSPVTPQMTHAMPSDMLTPLLMSSAKPFSRQTMTNAATHSYHHVNVPIRKVNSPTSPKHMTSANTETVPLKSEPSEVPLVLETTHPELVKPKPPVKSRIAHPRVEPEPSPTTSFTEDLSSLHSARQPLTPPFQVKETIIIEKETPPSENINSPKRISLKNGETLHSSGTKVQPRHRAVDTMEKTMQLQDKSNFTHSSAGRTRLSDGVEMKLANTQKGDIEPLKKEALFMPKKAETAKPPEMKNEPKLRPFMKENNVPIQRRREKSENQFKQVVNESLDESMLKSQAAKAANRIMQSSKTFKITPSKTAGTKNFSEPSRDIKDSTPEKENASTAAVSIPDGLAFQQTRPVPKKRHETVITGVKHEQDDKPSTAMSPRRAVKEWPPAKPPSDLPSTSIDDLIDGPDLTTSSLPLSPEEVNKEEKPAPVKPTVLKITPKETVETNAQNSYKNRTSPNSVSITPKSEPVQRPFTLGTKSSKSSRGKCFVIDPSKFRKSSAQPPTAAGASTAVQNSGNTRMIVPGVRSHSTEADFGGEAPKTGKRKLTVDQITVIGGYVSLERPCLVKQTKRKKSVTLSFSEKELETTYTYVSERSLLREDTVAITKNVTKSPGFGKDSTIGKYTPKYLLSMKATEIVDEEDDSSESKTVTSISIEKTTGSTASTPNDATPLPDDNAALWSDTTSDSTDILF